MLLRSQLGGMYGPAADSTWRFGVFEPHDYFPAPVGPGAEELVAT
ncbi:hypothetical protein [Pyrobaculum sp.]